MPELPFLNLDAATALALPLAQVEARAQFRFAFRSNEGEEEWLLARLCVVEETWNDRYYYCVVMCSEAEAERIFVADDWRFHFSIYRGSKPPLTPAEAEVFDWESVARAYREHKYSRQLSRYWKTETEDQTILFKIDTDGYGALIPHEEWEDRTGLFTRILWKARNRFVEVSGRDLRFLKTSNADFCATLEDLWRTSDGEFQFARRWLDLDEFARDELAFACDNGDWEELRRVAEWVFKIRISREKLGDESGAIWHFAAYGDVEVENFPTLHDDGALRMWREVLTTVFGTRHVDGRGVKYGELPECLLNYFDEHERSFVGTEPSSMHELLEVRLKLRDWANAHLPAQIARILLDSLEHFDEYEARIFWSWQHQDEDD